MEAIDHEGPYQLSFIVELKPTGKIQRVRVTVTAKLVIRGGWQNV
jgi:hypothetical protein